MATKIIGGKTTDPINFLKQMEVFTVVVICSFISWKLLGSIYDNLFIPSFDSLIKTNNADNYYLDVGPNGLPLGKFFHELIKWIILIILMMVIYYCV